MPRFRPGGHAGTGRGAQGKTRLGRSAFAKRPAGPRSLIPADQRVSPHPPPAPAGWFGSQEEWYVWWYLTAIRKLQPDEDFSYQVNVAGGHQPGGLVPDFIVHDGRFPYLAILVNGVHWHGSNPLQIATTERDRAELERSVHVVIVWDDDLHDRLEYVMALALDQETEIPRPMEW